MKRPTVAANDSRLIDGHHAVVDVLQNLTVDLRSLWDALDEHTHAALLDRTDGAASSLMEGVASVQMTVEALDAAYRNLHGDPRPFHRDRQRSSGRGARKGSTGATTMRQRVISGVRGMGFPTAWEVGGCVRDELLGRPIKDVDVVVAGVTADELLARCAREGAVEQLTVADQLVGVRLSAPWTPKEAVEIALARTETSTGGGHQDFQIVPISPDPGWRDELWSIRSGHRQQLREHVLLDLARRDFTCNAIARDVETGEILDPFNGTDDIRAGVIRTVSADSFRDDPLRMYRLLARISKDGSSPAPQTLEQLEQWAPTLTPRDPEDPSTIPLSFERVRDELDKALSGRSLLPALLLAADHGLLTAAIPEWRQIEGLRQPAEYHAFTVDRHSLIATHAAAQLDAAQRVRWTMLLHDIGKGDPDVAWVWAVDAATGTRRAALLSTVDRQLADGVVRSPQDRAHFAAKPAFAIPDPMHTSTRRSPNAKVTVEPSGISHQAAGAAAVETVLGRLRCDRRMIKDVRTLVAGHMFPHDSDFSCLQRNAQRMAAGKPPLTPQQIEAHQRRKAREFIAEFGREYARDLITVRWCDRAAKRAEGISNHDAQELQLFRARVHQEWEQPLTLSELAVNGRDVMGAGLRGPLVGRALRRLLQRVVAEPELNRRAALEHELAALAKQLQA